MSSKLKIRFPSTKVSSSELHLNTLSICSEIHYLKSVIVSRTCPFSGPVLTVDRIVSSEESSICVPEIRTPRFREMDSTVESSNDQKDLHGLWSPFLDA